MAHSSHDVFVNCPDPAVRRVFAIPLCRRFICHGLRVFLSKLDVGRNVASRIEAAVIGVASVRVAIFSQNYAQSEGSLDEVVLMLESGGLILPVYYGVTPSDLRFTGIRNDGAFAEALRNHEQLRTSVDTIRVWRDALRRITDISGFLLDAGNGDQNELLDMVVQPVLSKFPRIPLGVPKYPIGLAEKMEDFENSVLSERQEEPSEGKVVGIVGPQGVGKTTLGMQFFNHMRSDYSGSSFIFDVGENARKTSLDYLRNELIQDLNPRNPTNESAEGGGVETLKQILTACRALIILDGVDHPDQLNALLPIRDRVDGLNPESLILITSRDRGVLTRVGVRESSIYRLEGLNRSQSRELFCFHAFSQSYPPQEFEGAVDELLWILDESLPGSIGASARNFLLSLIP